MAAFHCPIAAVLQHRVTEKTLYFDHPISCISSSLTAGPTGRKNYLRRKILKTLEKPGTPKLPAVEPIVPVCDPLIGGINESGDVEKMQEFEKTEIAEAGHQVENSENSEETVHAVVSVPSGVNPDGTIEMFPDKNAFLKYGLCLLASFVFQAFCAIYFFSSPEADSTNERMEKERNGKDKSALELAPKGMDSMIHLKGLEMEMKIEEIRIMARKAREMERLETETDENNEDDDDDEGNYDRSGIKEEVDNKLTLLRKKLEKDKNDISAAASGHVMNDHKISDVGKQDLLFKRKYKFRGSPIDPMDQPKGFGHSDDKKLTKSKEIRNLENDYQSDLPGFAEDEDDMLKMIQSNQGFTRSRRKAKNERESSKKGSSRKDASKSKDMLPRKVMGA